MLDLKPRISRRTIAWIVSLVLLFLLAGFLLLPQLARPYVEDALQDKLKRPVSIGALHFNPLTLAASVDDIAIGENGSTQKLLHIKRVYANISTRSIWDRAPVIEEIEVEQPQVHLVRNADNSYNFDDLIEIFSQPSEGPPAKFSLNNVHLTGGRIDFDDKAAGARHTLADLTLGIPFLSNLPYATEIKVKPELSATVNGAPFKLAGESLPFSAGRDTAVKFSLQQLDLPGYLKYVPVPLGFTLKSGKLQADLTVTFRQPEQGTPLVKLSGTAALDEVVANETDGKPLLAFKRLAADLADADLASRRVQLRSMALEQPQLTVQREKDGKLNLQRAAEAKPGKQNAAQAKSAAASKDKDSSRKDTNARDKDGQSWSIEAAALTLTGGTVDFKDLSLAKPFETRLKDLAVTVKQFNSAPNKPFSVEAALQTEAGESIKHKGNVSLQPFKAEGEASLARLDLKRYAPYYEAQAGMAAQQGALDVSTRYKFEEGDSAQLFLSGLAAKLDALALRMQGGSTDFVRIAGLELKGGELDLAKRSISLESLQSKDGKIALALSEDGQLGPATREPLPQGKRVRPRNAERAKAAAVAGEAAGKQASGPASNASTEAPAVKDRASARQAAAGTTAKAASQAKQAAANQKAEQPWQFQLKNLALDGYGVRLQSVSQGRSAILNADALRLHGSNLSNAKGSSGKLDLQGRLGKNGYLRANGNVALTPLDVDLRLDAKGFELVPLQPFFGDKLNITLTDGAVSTRGRLRLGSKPDNSLRYAFNGDAKVDRLATIDKVSGEEFLKWRSLRVRQINAGSEPVMKLAIGEVALADFYTRLVINRDGTFNYQDVLAGDKPGTGPVPTGSKEAAGKDAGAQGGKQAEAQPAPSAAASAKPAAADTSGTPAAAKSNAAKPMQISVGKVVLQRGHVDFRDNFIQPNYSAELTQLAGSVSGLSSDPSVLAEVAVKGRVENQGQLDITGKLNPLSGNLFLDLLARLSDFELSPLTPYAAKYAGYGIEKGKLSFDVRYKVENRKLTAENRLVLNRLTFGEKVDSPTATKLPVLLAVALLQDRNGNIDLNLPISGSLDDPQFSVGGIIVKAIFNLIGRAVTAPFSLIAGMFADSGQSSHIDFASGRRELQPKAREKLQSLAKALLDRPALKLDISGRADAGYDSAGLKQVALERKLKVLKLKQLVKEGESVASADEVQISAAEYPRYLAQVYAQESFPGKPRNIIGMAKSLPPDQMQALLLQNMTVRDEDIRALANKRAQDVKDHLVQEGKVPSERLFIVGARAGAEGEDKLPKGRVDFLLGAR